MWVICHLSSCLLELNVPSLRLSRIVDQHFPGRLTRRASTPLSMGAWSARVHLL